ncbi:MAG: hypothetical protein A3F12_04635 [Gammaproteobacteria bacterium RIFCSPHIGHO2_12_FULL_38_14]|nr:MAG: hypothetical protein A3F12_04635 [Gammaproteobacteria bacterium RIFCSPHIGHO2_12_FULL_38_14]
MLKLFKATSYRQSMVGAMMFLMPAIIILLLTVSAVVVDIGAARVARAQLQTVTDAAATAALNAYDTIENASAAASNVASQNQILDNRSIENFQVQFGYWDKDNRSFTVDDDSPNAVRVTASVRSPIFFSKLFQSEGPLVTTTSIASMRPRDIYFIVDVANMTNIYSRLSGIDTAAWGSSEAEASSAILASNQLIYEAMNLPQYGNMTYEPVTIMGSVNKIKNDLGLNGVDYPFPSGSWEEYIEYVRTSSLGVAVNQDYKHQYGYLTLIDYLLTLRYQYSETPALLFTPEQPLRGIKDSIQAFMQSYLTVADRVGLFTFGAGLAPEHYVFAQPLTNSTSAVTDYLYGGAAGGGVQSGYTGPYQSGSYPAIVSAIDQLIENGRDDAEKIIFIFTAAQTDAGVSVDSDAYYEEAVRAKDNNITINTIVFPPLGFWNMYQEMASYSGGSSLSVYITTTIPYSLQLFQMNNLRKIQIVH